MNYVVSELTSDSRKIWPTGKLIDLANHLPSSSPRGVLSFTQRFFMTIPPRLDLIWSFSP